MIIRAVKHEDFDRICELMCNMVRESPFYRQLQPSSPMLKMFLENAVEKPEQYYLRAFDVDGQVVGGFFGHCYMPVFSCDKMAEDFSLFLAPEYRSKLGKHVIDIVEGFFTWAKQQDVKIAVCGILAGVNNEVVSKMYDRMNIPRVGYIHARSL